MVTLSCLGTGPNLVPLSSKLLVRTLVLMIENKRRFDDVAFNHLIAFYDDWQSIKLLYNTLMESERARSIDFIFLHPFRVTVDSNSYES